MNDVKSNTLTIVVVVSKTYSASALPFEQGGQKRNSHTQEVLYSLESRRAKMIRRERKGSIKELVDYLFSHLCGVLKDKQII